MDFYDSVKSQQVGWRSERALISATSFAATLITINEQHVPLLGFRNLGGILDGGTARRHFLLTMAQGAMVERSYRFRELLFTKKGIHIK